MLKPTDKVSFGLMSKLPGCNVSERRAAQFRWAAFMGTGIHGVGRTQEEHAKKEEQIQFN